MVASYLALDPYGTVLGRLLRSLGLPLTWLLLGAPLYFTGKTASDRRCALLLGFAPLAAAAAGVLLKLLIARPRPGPNPGAIAVGDWVPASWYSGAYSMPSTDAAVAAAAATVLWHCWPRGRPWCVGFAVLCGLARVASGAHYLSDVVVGGIVGWFITLGLRQVVHR